MSGEQEHARFEQDLLRMMKDGKGDEAQDLVFADASTEPFAPEPELPKSTPASAPNPSSQPVESTQPDATSLEQVQEVEPIELKGSDALNGVLDFGGANDDPSQGEQPIGKGTKTGRSSGVKRKLVVSAIVLLGAAYLMLPAEMPGNGAAQRLAKVPAPAAVAVPKAANEAQTQPLSVAAEAAQSDAPAPAVPQVTGLDISVMGESPQSQESLVAEIARDRQAIPEAERTCASGYLSNGERSVCNKTGHIKFIQCTSGTGRIWDVRLPGCEVI